MRLKTLKPAIRTLTASPIPGAARGNSTQRGYTYRWQQYRKRWLAEHPTCGERSDGPSTQHSQCARDGRVTAATDVDHIERITGPNDSRFWDPSNHQSLCHACHSVKTQTEQAGGGSKP
jgi:5-methylcytosine-specific restriction protein A